MAPFALIIFGITGNLAQIKLLPALYDLAEKNLLPKDMTIIGVGRKKLTEEEFKEYIHKSIHSLNHHHKHDINGEVAGNLLNHFHYLSGHFEDSGETADNTYLRLKELLKSHGKNCQNHIYYLATYPDLYENIFHSLEHFGLSRNETGWVRLMIEKPLGHNLKSAQELDKLLHQFFSEDQIYRLDHYLGKETLQNILMFRFGNGIFEPLISYEHLDHIQVTAAEDIGVGKRGGYYDHVGALKDVGQNHELQLIAAACMDAPSEFSNAAITMERIKILQNLVANPQKLIYGQYKGYTSEENIDPNSQTETFFALKTEINNQRFKGVPIYVRAGKKLPKYVTEINLIFKNPVNRLFTHLEMGDNPNVLTYRVFPDEGIGLQIVTKNPTHEWQLDKSNMQFCYKTTTGNELPDPYEKLLYDAMRGDQTFFNDAQEVEAEWAFTDALLAQKPEPISYDPGTWGPKSADELIEADGRKWIVPSEEFCKI